MMICKIGNEIHILPNFFHLLFLVQTTSNKNLWNVTIFQVDVPIQQRFLYYTSSLGDDDSQVCFSFLN